MKDRMTVGYCEFYIQVPEIFFHHKVPILAPKGTIFAQTDNDNTNQLTAKSLI
jgi:hypothetical protein